MAQIVKNLPAIRETQIQSLSQEDPLENGMATHSSIFAWRIPWVVPGVTKSQTPLGNKHFDRMKKKGSERLISSLEVTHNGWQSRNLSVSPSDSKAHNLSISCHHSFLRFIFFCL